MQSKIRLLSDHTINKIAAGEVIENPSSVIKELVENSLDAGATDICVEIRGGGRQSIRVTDNGSGMTPDDAILCLERHATSKIRSVEDLSLLDTMGFRGEAIPSIAAISKFMLLTAPHDAQMGTMVLVDGGNIMQNSPVACPAGTTIEVKSLFFNVPVRKKFLKSPAHDANEILKMMTLLALGHPDVKFQLISNEEILLNGPKPKTNDFIDRLGERIAAVLGSDFQSNCCPIQVEKGGIKLQGYIGYPDQSRHNRSGQYLLINRRGVVSPLIAYSLKDAYGPMLGSNRHPVFVLHLTLPGALVDVNVHPQKREVRLRQEDLIKELTLEAVEKALHPGGMSPFPAFEFPVEPYKVDFEPLITPPVSFPSTPVSVREPMPPRAMMPTPSPQVMSQPTLFSTATPATAIPTPKVLTTIPGYLVVDPQTVDRYASGSLCLVDQRAAHARVIFERISEQEAQAVSSQSLLIPYTWEASPAEAALLRIHLDALNRLGLGVKEFGQQTFLVDALPSVCGNIEIKGFVSGLLDRLQMEEEGAAKGEREAKALAASASAINRNRKLPFEEAQALLQQLMRCKNPYYCPHGKPTMTAFSSEDLARQFK